MGSGDAPPEHVARVAPRHNLPVSLTGFIGREHEIAEVRRLLATVRLLTLTGAPGVGKTRLALEVAAGMVDRYPGGVWLVELAPLADPAWVPRAVAVALGLREQPGRPILDLLVDALRERRLLVLDNCEHVIDACAELADVLLRACPSLVIMATSREPLGIDGETAWRVPSLTLPDLELPSGPGSGDPLALAACSAVQLFVGRACAVRPDFALTALHAPAIARICHRLDGIPLALELAAARVMALSVEQIAERLDDRFRLLTGGNRTALPHQRTLRATVDWSYDLLSAAERVLLCRLAVFAGGWSLEAAEAICAGPDLGLTGPDSANLDSADVIDLLQRLVDRSLVVAETRPDGANHFRMLEMLQQYACERLGERGEEDALRRRHAAYFLALAERAEGELRGPHEAEWSGRLEGEAENLRLALRWHIEGGRAEPALRMSGALWRFWSTRGHLTEGLDWLEQALALAPSPDATVGSSVELARARASALNGAGNLATGRGEHARAVAFLEESLALRRDLGDEAGVAVALHNLGTAARNLGDPALAQARFDESLGLFRRLGDTTNAALSLLNLGRLSHDVGEYERATTLYGEGMALFQAVGSDHGVATALNRLADLARERGDLVAAERRYRDALALREGRGDRWVTGLSLTGLARVAILRGDFVQAMTLIGQSLRSLHEAGASRDTAAALVVLARAAGATGQAAVAARLLGAVARAYPNRPVIRAEREGFAGVVATVRSALDPAAFDAAWATGHHLTLDQAVAQALSLTACAAPAAAEAGATIASAAPSTQASPPVEAVTRREREVAGLIARGLTNRQIAEILVVSEMTVDSHVSHILRKLGFRGRAQIAGWAVQHGLRPPDPA